MDKKQLFLDLDGCILNFDNAYLPVLSSSGIDISKLDFSTWELLKGEEYSRDKVYKLVVKAWESKAFEELPLLHGAEEFLNWAIDFYKIVYITTVPEPYHKKRTNNLNSLGILEGIHADIHFAKSHRDKARIVKSYNNGVAFVDDKPKNVSAVKEDVPNIIAIWYNHNGKMKIYNHTPKPDHEIHEWKKVKNLLKSNGKWSQENHNSK